MELINEIVNHLGKGEVEQAVQFAASQIGRGQEQALIRTIDQAYTHLIVRPVEQFLELASSQLGDERAALLAAAMNPRVERTRVWAARLNEMRRERYAREMRSAIRDNNIKLALQRLHGLMASSADANDASKEMEQLALYAAGALGTLDHDQNTVKTMIKHVMRDPQSVGMTEAVADRFETFEANTFGRLGTRGLEGREREFNRAATQAATDVRTLLQGMGMATGEPTEEEVAKLFEELDAVFRAIAGAGNADGLSDATTLLVELTPRDPRSVGPVEQAEARLFLSLNPRQKLCCVRALRRLGSAPRLVALYRKYAESPLAEAYTIPVIEVMGGIGNVAFMDFILKTLKKGSVLDPRFSTIDALGRLEQEAATDTLMARLQALLKSRPFDPPKRRECEAIARSLGRISRNPSVSRERRNQIVREAIRHIPEEETQFGIQAALNLCGFRPEQLDDDIVQWCVGRIGRGLWSQDMRSTLHRESEGREADLGFRMPLVDLAVRIGSRGLQPLLSEANMRLDRSGGAYYALAEIVTKIGDESALPFLKRMALNQWMANEETSKYNQETYYDTAEGVVKPVTRDRIIHGVLHAIRETGGAEGKAFLVDMARQVRSKQLESPGPQTGAFLMDSFMRFQNDATAQEDAGAESPATVLLDSDNPYSNADAEELNAALTARYLMAKTKRTKKIQAIQEIGRRRAGDCLDALVDQLLEKDAMIRAAATTAVQEFARPGAKEAAMRRLAEALLDRLDKWKSDEREPVRSVLTAINPRREPFKSLIDKELEMAPDGPYKSELIRLVRTTGPSKSEEAGGGAIGAEFIAGAAKEQDERESRETAAQSDTNNAMEAKRQYFNARRAWIDGGKKGPPPDMPASLKAGDA